MNRKILLAFLLMAVLLGVMPAAYAEAGGQAVYYLPNVEAAIKTESLTDSMTLLSLDEAKELQPDYFTGKEDYALRWRVTPSNAEEPAENQIALLEPGKTYDLSEYADEGGVKLTAVLGFEATIDPELSEDNSDVYVEFVEAGYNEYDNLNDYATYVLPENPDAGKSLVGWRRASDGTLCYESVIISNCTETFTAFYAPATASTLTIEANFVDEDADVASGSLAVDFWYNGESERMRYAEPKRITTEDNKFTISGFPIDQPDSRYPLHYEAYISSDTWMRGYDPENSSVAYVTGTFDPRKGEQPSRTLNVEMLRADYTLNFDQVDNISTHEVDVTFKLWNNMKGEALKDCTYSGYKFDADGETVVSMKDGESVKFTDLPASVTVNVEVPEKIGYMYSYSADGGEESAEEASLSFSSGILWGDKLSAVATIYADYTETTKSIYLTAMPDGSNTLGTDRLNYEVTLKDFDGNPITTLTYNNGAQDITETSEEGVFTVENAYFDAGSHWELKNIPYGAAYSIRPYADYYTFNISTGEATASGTVGDDAIYVSFYSHYTGTMCTVTLKDEHGTTELGVIQARAGASISLDDYIQTSPYFKFLGWKDEQGTITFTGETYEVTEDVTLVEAWQRTTNLNIELGEKLSPLVPESDKFSVMIGLKDEQRGDVTATYDDVAFSEGMATVELASNPNGYDLVIVGVPTYYHAMVMVTPPNEEYYIAGEGLTSMNGGYYSEITVKEETNGTTIDFDFTYSGTVTVSFSGGEGATGEAPESIVLSADDYTFTVPGANTLVKENSTFKGWTDLSGVYGDFNEGDEVNSIYTDVTLTAVWEDATESEDGDVQDPDNVDCLYLWGDITNTNVYSYESTPATLNVQENESFYAYDNTGTAEGSSPHWTVLYDDAELLTKTGDAWGSSTLSVAEIQDAVSAYEAENGVEISSVKLELTRISGDVEDETYKATAELVLPEDESENTSVYITTATITDANGKVLQPEEVDLSEDYTITMTLTDSEGTEVTEGVTWYWDIYNDDYDNLDANGTYGAAALDRDITKAELDALCPNATFWRFIIDAYIGGEPVGETINFIIGDEGGSGDEGGEEELNYILELTDPVTEKAYSSSSDEEKTIFLDSSNKSLTLNAAMLLNSEAVEDTTISWAWIGTAANGDTLQNPQGVMTTGSSYSFDDLLAQANDDGLIISAVGYLFDGIGTGEENIVGSTGTITIHVKYGEDPYLVFPLDCSLEGNEGEALSFSVTAHNISDGYKIAWTYDSSMPMSLRYSEVVEGYELPEGAVLSETINDDGSVTSTISIAALNANHTGTYFPALYDANGYQWSAQLITVTVNTDATEPEPETPVVEFVVYNAKYVDGDTAYATPGVTQNIYAQFRGDDSIDATFTYTVDGNPVEAGENSALALTYEEEGTHTIVATAVDGETTYTGTLTLVVAEKIPETESDSNVLVDPTLPNSETNPRPKEIDVTGILADAVTKHEPEIYSVEITWGAMAFQYDYTTTTTRVWDAVNHSYTQTGPVDSEGSWTLIDDSALTLKDDAAEIFPNADQSYVVVFNHSNAQLGVGMTNAAADTNYNVDSALKKVEGGVSATSATDAEHTYTLGRGVENKVYDAGSGTAAQIELSKTPDKDISSDADTPSTVATLTVTFSKVS